MFRLFRRNREKGAVMVEFALILPLFLLLIFGTMEAGWVFAQMNDIHHGVREGARLAAVNYDADEDGTPDVLAGMCGRLGLVSGSNPTVTLSASDTNGDGFIGRGDTANAAVTVDYQSLTGFLDFAFGSLTMGSNTNFLLEQPLEGPSVTWMYGPGGCP